MGCLGVALDDEAVLFCPLRPGSRQVEVARSVRMIVILISSRLTRSSHCLAVVQGIARPRDRARLARAPRPSFRSWNLYVDYVPLALDQALPDSCGRALALSFPRSLLLLIDARASFPLVSCRTRAL